MSIEDRFSAYAETFEQVFVDDNWDALKTYFAADAIYITRGQSSTRDEGRDAVLHALKKNISAFDRRCDTRQLTTLVGPTVKGNHLQRIWQCRFTLDGAPDLTIQGMESVTYRDDLIVLLEEELEKESQASITLWVANHASLLFS